jgi:hypothetical protein
VAIPTGRFQLTMYNSPHFHRSVPLLVNVPGRSYILIHWGNYPENSDGCILVGETEDAKTGDIYNSKTEFGKLFPAIEAAVAAEGAWISVE